jgi:predicted DNA-binding transcriptional regulator AlpA
MNQTRQSNSQDAAANLVAALDRLMAQHAATAARERPEMMLDRDIRAEYFGGISRSTYWAITKRDDFPKAIEVSHKVKLRRRSEIEAWLSERETVG